MTLEHHTALQARAGHFPTIHEDKALGRFFKSGEDIEDGGLAASRMADDADKLTLGDAEVHALEDGQRLAASLRREALGESFDPQESIGRAHSRHVTMRCAWAKAKSSSIPTTPISKMAKITLVKDRLFHSFHTK